MNVQNSSSIDINSSEDRKEDINEVIVMMNNQFLKVRRPNEDNILDYLNYDQQNNKEKLTSKDNTLNLESPQQALLQQKNENQSYFEFPNSPQKTYNSILLKLVNEEQNAAVNLNEFSLRYQMILNDLCFNYSPLDQQLIYKKLRNIYQQFYSVYDIVYFVIGFLFIYECTITIAFGTKQIFNISFYVIQYFIMVLESIIQFKEQTQMNNIYESVSHVLIFVLIIVNNLIEFQYLCIVLFLHFYFSFKKYKIVKQNYLLYIKNISTFEIVIVYLLFIHVSALIFFIVSNNKADPWIEDLNEGKDWTSSYCYSLFWSITTITTVGQNVIQLRNESLVIVTILIQISNIVFIIFVVINIQKWFLKFGQFTENVDVINHYLNEKKISKKLQQEIKSILYNKWQEKYLSNHEQEQQILQLLPQYLNEDLKIEMFQKILQQIPFFQQISYECYREIILQFKEYTFSHNEILDQTGLYYCSKGSFELFLPNSVRIESPQQNNAFYGLNYLFYDKPDVCQAVSINKTQFIYLSRYSFLKVMRKYPVDYQMYRMQLEMNQLDIGIQCPLCQDVRHGLEECPKIHLFKNKLSVISNHLTSEDMGRAKFKRKRDRSTNAVFSQRLFEDAASMFQEILIQDETIKEFSIVPQQIQNNNPRKKSKSLNSDENSKALQKSNSGHSLSAIQKPQGSGLSFSTFSMFKDVQGQRKISKQQDSDKISSNSQNKQHQSSSNSFKDLPITMNMEDKIVDDSIFAAQPRIKKQQIGKQGTTSIKITPPNAPLQAIPSVSDINTLNEDSFVHQYSMSSKRYSSPQKKVSSKATVETQKQFEQLEMQKMEFECPINLMHYFPQHNIQEVIEKFKNIQNREFQ
ncbi:unnamed protein product [Paramecium octaurelia]|uniref:Cyclic nucleotide-binding domain-containing protein n=1 Tax=Paramecium octaurelia TaxID=43137 RepID=A0A8S1WV12_PAROT|nr:unnamed protein product [Paramecium octaurelia]